MHDNDLVSSGSAADPLDKLFSNLEVSKLPSLPHVLLVLLDATHTEVISFDRLSDLIRKDAGLSARITAVANTAYFGGQGKSLNLERTLVLLGLDTIKTIAITACVQQFFSRFDSASTRRLKLFWRDSLTCAMVAKAIAKLTGYPYPDEAYLAGLMHNLGQLIFESNFPQEVDLIWQQGETDEERFRLEIEHIGASRYEAGAWLVSSWKLDSFIDDAVRYQGEAIEQVLDSQQLVKIIYAASRLCATECDAGVEGEETGYVAAERLFDLNRPLLRGVLEESRADVAEAARSMNIDIASERAAVPDSDAVSETDELKQIELAENVRSIALMDGVRQQLARVDGETAILQALKQGLNILFGGRKCVFFFYDDEKQALRGKALDEGDAQIEQLSIPLQGGGGAITAAVLEKRVTSSMEDSATIPVVVDRQVARITGEHAILCLPLLVDSTIIGVMAIGYDESEHHELWGQLSLFGMLANEASYKLLKHLEQAERNKQAEEDGQSYYQARAREIVHEASNPLSIVKNYVHILSAKLDQQGVADDAVQEELSIIREELDRAGSILLRLPGITDKQTTESGADLVDINLLLSDVLKVFRSSLFVAHRTESVLEQDESMASIVTDRNALKQVFTNLIKNAVEAMPDGGRLQVATQAAVNQNGKNYVSVVVSDEGPGIPQQIQEKLFSPVETTKGKEHAGLGLSIVKNLVDGLGGVISCRSKVGDGTRFEILIPRLLDDDADKKSTGV